jgi:hypothetical protein
LSIPKFGKNAFSEDLFVITIDQLDTYYESLEQNTPELLPDGILDVNIRTLQTLHLLTEDSASREGNPSELLQAVESEGRITLFNERFALWIVPQVGAEPSSTVVYVATHRNGAVKAELGFRTSGVHNKSKTILRLIDRFITDIQETDSMLSQMERP